MSSSVNETINDLIQFGFINEKNYLLFNKKSYELTQKGHNLLEAMELVYDIAYGGAIAEEGRNGENPAQTARIKE